MYFFFLCEKGRYSSLLVTFWCMKRSSSFILRLDRAAQTGEKARNKVYEFWRIQCPVIRRDIRTKSMATLDCTRFPLLPRARAPPSFVFPDCRRGRGREVAFCASEFRMPVFPQRYSIQIVFHIKLKGLLCPRDISIARNARKIASRWAARLFMQTRVVVNKKNS